MITRIFNNKSGQIHFMALILLFLLVGIIIVAAEDLVGENLSENNTAEENIQIDLCQGVICEDSEIICPDGTIAECSNSCNPESGECTSCIPSCVGHEQPIETLADNTDESSNEGNDSVSQSIENLGESPNLQIEITHDSKISRGEILEIQGVITNFGEEAKNVEAEWILPEGFEIVSNDKEDCGNVGKNEFCLTSIEVQPSLSTSLGINEIKLGVSYDE